MTHKSSSYRIRTELYGSGAVAQGNGAVASSGGSVAVGRNINGNVTVTVNYQGVPVDIPSPDAVAAHRVALRKQLQANAYKRWGGMAVYIQEEGAALPVEASPYQAGLLGEREELLRALHDAHRLLVLGGPGSGKTVSLERLAWELCSRSELLVPVLVQLFRYDGVPLAEWVRAYLQETGHLRLDDLRALAAFLKEGTVRCFFLFDGLNEVQPVYRNTLVGELERWIKFYPRHPVVLTSRSQDELWRRLRDEVDRALIVQPISDEQARSYLMDHLGEKGLDLYMRLDERLREMARTPLILWFIKESGAVGESVPGNRGELYARFVSRMLRRDTDRRMDAGIPERLKQRALTDLAWYMGCGQRLSCPHEEAVRVLTRRFTPSMAHKLVSACRRHGLLAGEQDLWFAPHQTVQEHFAAQALRERLIREWDQSWLRRGWQKIRRKMKGYHPTVLSLATQEWWMETWVQLAGVLDRATRLVEELAKLNPWLAFWCMSEGREVSQRAQFVVEERSIHILRSKRVADRRRAAAALAQIRNPRAVEPLLWAAGDSDSEISAMAIQALEKLGKAVYPRAITALKNEGFLQGVLRYGLAYPNEALCAHLPTELLEEEWGFPVVWVPPGPFLMGSDGEQDSLAYFDERPQHEVALPGFWISKHPVTVAQFRRFKFEYGYEVDERSLKDPYNHPVRYVSWYDALAYCRWLKQRVELPVTLPSESEWEKAARGTDGRIYPWGNEPPRAELCNFKDDVRGPTPVGSYSPQGDSPYGCSDMASNVWEWTRSLYVDYPYDPRDGREKIKVRLGTPRVLRGGSWISDRRLARCSCRNGLYPTRRWHNSGFRVVVAPFSSTEL